jgi:polyphosphate glucokinase
VEILGIDVGGSGVKGAPVDVKKGALTADRFRVPTPQPSTPDAVASAVANIVRHFRWKGPIGCTVPGVVRKGVVYTAANIDRSWIRTDGRRLLQKRTGCRTLLLNDADAAGMAEMKFGAGKRRKGVVMVLTFGTGIGSAVFINGVLVPNTEFGHVPMMSVLRGGIEAEEYCSDRIRQDEQLDWVGWADRVNEYLALLEALFSPDLFILGGGVSKQFGEFLPLLRAQVQIVPARLLNEAGIVGAALAAKTLAKK